VTAEPRRPGGGSETPLARLSKPPTRAWPDGFLHHGSRAFLLLLVAVAVTLFFPPPQGARVGGYEIGVVADQEILASLSFGVPKNLDELNRERGAAAAAVPPTFQFRPEAADLMQGAIRGFLGRIQALDGTPDAEGSFDRLLSDLGLVLSPAQRSFLRDGESRALLAEAAGGAIQRLIPTGVLDEAARLESSGGLRLLVIDPDGVEQLLFQDSVLTTRDFYQEAALFLPQSAPPEVHELLRLLLIRFMEPSLRFDPLSTERDRNAARSAVSTIKANVVQGEAIVRANQQLGEADVERLRAYEEALRSEGLLEGPEMRFATTIGSLLLNFILLGVFGGLLYFFRPDVYGNFRWLLLLGILILTYTGAAGWIARAELPAELLPIAFVSLGVAVLWDGRLALILVATLAILTGAQAPFASGGAWLPVFVAGSAAALSVRAVRRRAQTWIFIAIIAAAYLGVLLTLGLMGTREFPELLLAAAWAGGNAVVSAILVMGFLPVFEWFTRITTDQTLLEWADPNRPLLKRLSMEAPGTYAHTINVANLSEAAANAIGANGLLCRVGVYYHDVGKMLKPQYFIENQTGGRNPHDKLKAATSASIVRDHVAEGIRLAEEAKLPDVLVDFIPEHHGTQEISYFLDRATREGEGEVDPEQFRYPGPRPRSRETAIVMLADSVESATRALQDPTPERVGDLIDSIVADKIRQHQLDEAPLTLRELGTIRAQFQKVLSGVYHHRIDYPATRHLTESAVIPAEEAEGESRGEDAGGA